MTERLCGGLDDDERCLTKEPKWRITMWPQYADDKFWVCEVMLCDRHCQARLILNPRHIIKVEALI